MKNYVRSEEEQKTLDELNQSGEAARFDEGKERYDLISMPALYELGKHYANYEITDAKLGDLYNGALYHARSFWAGIETLDNISTLIWSARYFFELMDLEGELPHTQVDPLPFNSTLYPVRYDLIPPGVLNEVAKVYTYGTIKYNDNNWRMGMKWGKCYGPLERHAKKWRVGEIFDDESGLHHLSHSVWQCFALYEYSIYHKSKDSRYKFPE